MIVANSARGTIKILDNLSDCLYIHVRLLFFKRALDTKTRIGAVNIRGYMAVSNSSVLRPCRVTLQASFPFLAGARNVFQCMQAKLGEANKP